MADQPIIPVTPSPAEQVRKLREALALIGVVVAVPAAQYVPALQTVMGIVAEVLGHENADLRVSPDAPLVQKHGSLVATFAHEVLGPGEQRNAILAVQETLHG